MIVGHFFFLIPIVCVCVMFTHQQSFSTDGAVKLSFHKNGRFMGEAFSLDASVLLGRPLFPHVLCKSCSVRFLLDPTAPPWYPGPPGFTPLAALSAGQKVRSTLPPTFRAQCEVRLNSHYHKVFICIPVVEKFVVDGPKWWIDTSTFVYYR